MRKDKELKVQYSSIECFDTERLNSINDAYDIFFESMGLFEVKDQYSEVPVPAQESIYAKY